MDIFKLVGSVFVDTDKANNSLQKLDNKGVESGNKLGKFAKVAGIAMTATAAAIGATTVAMFKLAESSASSLDEIDKGSQKLNMTTEEYQKLSYACERSGMSIESFKKGMININNTLADVQNGVNANTSAYDQLGVSLSNADGSMRSSEAVLNDTLVSLANMEDVTQRNALANEIFGKSYTEMLPLLNQGGAGVEELMSKAEELGLVMDEDAVKAGAKFNDTVADIKDSLEALKIRLGSEVMPLFQKGMEFIIQHMPQIQKVVSNVMNVVQIVIKYVIVAIKETYKWIVQLIGWGKTTMQPAIEIFKQAWQSLAEAFAPVIAGVKALVEKWRENHKGMNSATVVAKILGAVMATIATTFKVSAKAISFVVKTITTFVSAIRGAVQAVKTMKQNVSDTFDSIKKKIKSVVESIKKIFKFKWEWPHIDTPHFKIKPDGWKASDLVKGKIPSISIDWYAKAMDEAAVLDGATIFGSAGGSFLGGGEAGREVVSGESHLIELINESVSNAMSDKLRNIEDILEDYLPTIAKNEYAFKWNNREVGRAVRQYG